MGSNYPDDVSGFIEAERAQLDALDAELPFSRNEYADRLVRLRSAMRQEGIDVLVITAPDAMAWLHGFACRVYEWHSTTNLPPVKATVVHAEQDPMFLVDTAFHSDLVRRTSCVEDFRPLPATGMAEYADAEAFVRFLTGELRAEGWLGGVVGLERWSGVPNPAVADVMNHSLRDAGCKIVDSTQVVRSVRRLKSRAEIAVIEQAQAACDAGLLTLQREAFDGMTELQAWHIYMRGVVAAGGEPSAIHETVFAGAPEAFGHAISSHRPIRKGQYFHADASAARHQYHARATRPFFFGPPPRELERLTAIAAGTQDVVLQTARAHLPFRELNHALQSYFRQQGIGDEVAFAGGYELGLSFPPDYVGEFLWGSHDIETDAVIEPGLVTNFEGVAYVAVIDTVVFEETGARFLSSVPREVLLVEP